MRQRDRLPGLRKKERCRPQNTIHATGVPFSHPSLGLCVFFLFLRDRQGTGDGFLRSRRPHERKKERNKTDKQAKGGMGGRHAATTQGF